MYLRDPSTLALTWEVLQVIGRKKFPVSPTAVGVQIFNGICCWSWVLLRVRIYILWLKFASMYRGQEPRQATLPLGPVP